MMIAGFGFRSAASTTSLRDALARTGLDHRVAGLATLDDKADTRAFRALAEEQGLPVHRIASEGLENIQTATESLIVRDQRKTGSVAEATALIAAGPGARLLCKRVISGDRMSTCAIACTPDQGGQR